MWSPTLEMMLVLPKVFALETERSRQIGVGMGLSDFWIAGFSSYVDGVHLVPWGRWEVTDSLSKWTSKADVY